jgi:hypothetical protein
MKTPADSSRHRKTIDVSAGVVDLLAQLHAHEQAAVSEAHQVKRIARRIERLITTSPHGLSSAKDDSDPSHRGDSRAPCEPPGDRAIEQANLFRFSKLL